MYEELMCQIRACMDKNIPCEEANCGSFSKDDDCVDNLLHKAVNAIEELSRVAEQSKRELDAILPWFGEFVMDMGEDGLKEIINAQREGRLIILPVTSGTPIFCDGAVFASHCAGQIHEITDWYYSYPMIQQYFRSELDYQLDPDEYNRSWFTDRKKCENYLNIKYHRESEVEQKNGV